MTIGAMAILIVVVVTFIGAPVISNSMGTPSVTFGTYDGVPIEFKDGNAFSDMVRTQSQRIGEVDVETAKRYIWRPAFERAVMNIGLEREARLGGLQVSSDRLKSMLRYNPAFLDKNGKFDYEKDANMSPSEKFRLRNTTESETLAMTYASYSTLGIRIVNTQNTDFVKKTIYPQRQFSFVVFNETDYPDEEVIQFATKNASLFNTLTLKKITLATEAEGKLKRDEKFLKKEKTFEELAKLYSKDELAASGGVMGSKFYYELKNEITKAEELDALFKLKKDEISFLTKTAGGWTFYQVTEESKPSDPKNVATITTARNYIIGSEPALIQNYLEAKAKALKAAAVGRVLTMKLRKLERPWKLRVP